MTDHFWQGKSAVVCGASAGLGHEFAVQLAHQGVRSLALIARSPERLEEVRQHIAATRPDLPVMCLAADMCQRARVADAVQEIIPQLGMIDLLVQTVGKSQRGRLLDLKSTDLQEMLDANLVSSLNAIQCFTPYLSQPGGRLVLIGSLASRFAPRFLGAYALSKHALAALAQQSRLELADLGIHVLLACPGPVARPDAGARYELPDTSQIPVSASLPGGGARLAGLDPHHLVTDILLAAARKKTEIIRPRRARLLQIVAAIAPALGDRLLRNNSS